MLSPRKFAKSVQYHARRARIAALSAPREVPWVRKTLRLPANQVFDPLADGSSRDVRVIPLEPGETFRRPPPHFSAASAAARPFFAARAVETTAPSYVAELDGGIAWGHSTGGVFTADGRFVPAFTHDPCGAAFHSVWTRFRLPVPQSLRGRVLYIVTPEAADNFHHWLIDLLPRLGQVQRAGYDLGKFDHVIVNHTDRPYQMATLARFGLTPDKIIPAHDGLFVRADQLVVPSLKPGNQALPAADVDFLREAFLGRYSPPPPHRRIFLSRADAAYRRLQNESELRPLLEAHGFEIISPSGLDLPLQARLFAESAVIAGPAGAAFANLVFGTAPAQVLEIAPPGWLSAFHWMISARVGLSHSLLLGEGTVMKEIPDVADREADIVVAPEKLAQALDDTLARLR